MSARNPGEALFTWRIAQSQSAIPSVSLELHVIGHSSAMAEALLIVVGNAIVQNAGIQTRSLSLNNFGSAESSGSYVRDVGQYLRKHIESISPTLRPRAATRSYRYTRPAYRSRAPGRCSGTAGNGIPYRRRTPTLLGIFGISRSLRSSLRTLRSRLGKPRRMGAYAL
jgi:hypothetical protein